MNKTNLINYIELDSFDVTISFSSKKAEIIKKMQENDILIDVTRSEYAIIQSKLLSLDIVFFISFQFKGEKLIAVAISPEKYLEGEALHLRYKKIQQALEKELGVTSNCIQSIMNFFDPDNQRCQWLIGTVKIEHFLRNRFGMEELVRILL